MKTEKERLLAMASAEEWDCWISAMSYETFENPFKDCLFCLAFGYQGGLNRPCEDCMGISAFGEVHDPYKRIGYIGLPCCKIPWIEREDAAIARLTRAGVFEEK